MTTIANSYTSACVAGYNSHNVSFDILVNGSPIKQFSHKNNTYIEGRKGSEYSIRVKNTCSCRILAVISVDGLSVIDGKPAGDQSLGWVIDGNSEINIPGWVVSNSDVAKFAFSGKNDSYAEKSDNDTNNVGVIGCLVFKEKTVEFKDLKYIKHYDMPEYQPRRVTILGPYIVNTPLWCSATLIGSSQSGKSSPTHNNNVNYTANLTQSCCSTPSETLGTAFGDKTSFKTTSTNFQRGDILQTIVIYYNTKRELEKIGIVFPKKEVKVTEQTTPNPFPAGSNFCIPPAGW